jgi:hypothetical protein
LAFADGRYRHFVAARHTLARCHAGGDRVHRNLVDCNHDIVFG